MDKKDVSEELTESIDDLFRYFDITDDSFSEPPQIAIHNGTKYLHGVVDSELHEILIRMYELVQSMQD